jgi:hypothetical protein
LKRDTKRGLTEAAGAIAAAVGVGLAIAAVAFLLAGSGRFGLDFLLRGKRQDRDPQ